MTVLPTLILTHFRSPRHRIKKFKWLDGTQVCVSWEIITKKTSLMSTRETFCSWLYFISKELICQVSKEGDWVDIIVLKSGKKIKIKVQNRKIKSTKQELVSLQNSVVITGAQTVLCYRIYSKTLYDPFKKDENIANTGSALYGFAVLGLGQRTHACPASPPPLSYPLSLFLGELFNAFFKNEVLKPLNDLSHHNFYYFTFIQRNLVLLQSMFIRRYFIFSPVTVCL